MILSSRSQASAMEEISLYTEQCDKTLTHMQKWYRHRLLFETGLREIACKVDENKEDSEGSGVASGDENADVDVDQKSSVSADFDHLAFVAEKDYSLTDSFVDSVITLQRAEESLLSQISFERNDGEVRPSSYPSSLSVDVVMAIVWSLSRRHLSKPEFLHEVLHTLCDLEPLSWYAVAVEERKKPFEESSLSGRCMAMYLRAVAYKVRCECEHVRCMVLEYLGAVYNEPAHGGA
ncbi:unnamed protein product [Cylicocyclus nassatus]|uniref:Uncharacterized protein n=1 Tax=Cylicocyclus nassatus TaxID=53992 RepID=A0AA36HH59_CYLNA|nr:unnamed protein product [Cylicocyclus nassatus]